LRRKLIVWKQSDLDDFQSLSDWISQWAKQKLSDRPDYTSDAIYLLPLSIALLRSQRTMELLTKILIFLTAVLMATELARIIRP
jgi:hypothetical protein